MFRSATEHFADAHSVGRFIYLEGSEKGPDELPEVLARKEVLRQADLDLLAERALSQMETYDNIFRDVTPGPEGLFRVGSEGSLQVYVDALGKNDSYRQIVPANLLTEKNITPQELINRLNADPRLTDVVTNLAVTSPDLDTPIVVGATDPDAPVVPANPRNPDVPIGMEDRTETVEHFAGDIDIEAVNRALSATDIEERVDRVEQETFSGDYIIYLQNSEPQFVITGDNINNAADLTAAILENLSMYDEEIAAAVEAPETLSLAPTVEAIMEAYGKAGNKGGILTIVNDAMGYARGTSDRITSIWGNTQKRLTTDEGLRRAFGVALGLTANQAPDAPDAAVAEGAEAAEVVEEVIEADHYISVLNNLESAADANLLIESLRGNQVQSRMLQRDLKLLGFYNGAIDGILGSGSRGALEAALSATNEGGTDRFATIYDIESAAREAEVVVEGERHGRRNPSVDALMAKIRAGEQITAADVAFTGREQGGSADRTREVMDFIEQAVAAGDIDKMEASRILELMMAEDSYPDDMELRERIAATLHDASARFIVGLSAVNPETQIREVSDGLRARIRGRATREQLTTDMHASESAIDFGTVDLAGQIQVDGQTFDMRTLTKMYILTGGGETAQGTGAVEVPIGQMTSALKIHNLVYRDGALVGTMENGCRGNLVIIPVERQYVPYVPHTSRGPRIVPPAIEPPAPRYATKHCRYRCEGDDRIKECRTVFNDTGEVYQDWYVEETYPNHPFCNKGGGDGDGDGSGGGGKGGSGNGGRSDVRWKEQIMPITDAVAKISQINGVNYYWKPEHRAEMGDQLEIGVIAQDVEKVFPEAVIKNKEGILSVKYDKLVGALVEAVKELNAEIQELKRNQ